MSSIRMMSLAVLSCLALVSPAHADKTTGQTVDDSALAASVKAKLVETKGVPSTAINIEVSKGRVQLGGFLETNAEKTAALAAAKSVSGVTKVSDGLVVIKKDRSAGQAIDDTTIQATLKSKLAGEDASKAWSINTDVYNGQVLMSGFIHGEKARAQAGEIAKSIKGVKQVYNKIELE
jgi:hyperosmotically inducible periplasmic protein